MWKWKTYTLQWVYFIYLQFIAQIELNIKIYIIKKSDYYEGKQE